ncbi:hypothetical protein KC614_04770 [candidate division WWE3 bacterium]|uniref:Uncharacterized protein n=1 Tax=candidate division WWE3 bacterium TaxID=2053526 RepID=A0A955LKL6_UNCKA|nr:hypothetical protein [candidate division WWE3 bacterium]
MSTSSFHDNNLILSHEIMIRDLYFYRKYLEALDDELHFPTLLDFDVKQFRDYLLVHAQDNNPRAVNFNRWLKNETCNYLESDGAYLMSLPYFSKRSKKA